MLRLGGEESAEGQGPDFRVVERPAVRRRRKGAQEHRLAVRVTRVLLQQVGERHPGDHPGDDVGRGDLNGGGVGVEEPAESG